jgi:hypothetical protein
MKNAPRSGLLNIIVNKETTIQAIEIVSKDKIGREKSAEIIRYELGISK